jgi:hypothetical protein
LLARELEPNRKLFSDHLSSILHGALVGAGSLWTGLHSALPCVGYYSCQTCGKDFTSVEKFGQKWKKAKKELILKGFNSQK